MSSDFDRYQQFAASPSLEKMWRELLPTADIERLVLELGIRRAPSCNRSTIARTCRLKHEDVIDMAIQMGLIANFGPNGESLMLAFAGQIMYDLLKKEREQQKAETQPTA